MLRPELCQYSSGFQQPQKNRNRRQRSSGQWRVMPSSQRDVSARRRCPEKSQPACPSSCAVQTHRCKSLSTDSETYTSSAPRRARRQHPKTSENRIDNGKGPQRKRHCSVDKRSESTAHRITERASQHGQVWYGGGGRQTAIATRSLGTQCELCHEDLSKWVVLMHFFKHAKAHDFARTTQECCNSRKSSCFRRLSQCVSSVTDAA